jgi:hypothetical protein
MKAVFAGKGHWLLGAAIALTGVVFVRAVAPLCEGGWGKAIQIAGYLLALAGMLAVAYGARRKALRNDRETRDEEAGQQQNQIN